MEVRGKRVEAADVRGHVRATLPGYIILRYIGVVPALPRTPAGKADRAELPPPSRGAGAAADAYAAPRTRTEDEVVVIWEELIETGPVGGRDDFFELDGHSLLLLRALARIHERLSVELDLGVVFGAPTVESLASAIVTGRSAAVPGDEPDSILDALAGLGDEQVRRAIGARDDRDQG